MSDLLLSRWHHCPTGVQLIIHCRVAHLCVSCRIADHQELEILAVSLTFNGS